MDFISTRDKNERVTASEGILRGLANNGGLYVPENIPAFDKSLEEFSKMSYQELAYHVMKLYFTDFTEAELRDCINKAYDDKFDTDVIAPLTSAAGAYYLELFHGATIAFKDMALSILPHLLTTSAKKNGIKNDIVILTATSGDTGKAALAGFADVPGTRIVVFYPKGGVSRIQELQMLTQKGDNTKVVGIEGNFDQAQTGVKQMFADSALNSRINEMGFQFSSANSINIGRLIPQIVYYVYAYVQLLANDEIANGEKINIVVPTGNFGNILAAYYAKNMGLPVNKLICASNDNKVLYDFFESGEYNRNREFILTNSPSMDILVSSNLERLIFRICDDDADKCATFMKDLNESGVYNISDDMRIKLSDFYGDYSTEEETCNQIKHVYEDCGYVLDTHTAVASRVYSKYVEDTGDNTKTVIASTASPYKFTRAVMGAIGCCEDEDDFVLVDKLSSISNVEIPNAIKEIRDAKIRHNNVCPVDGMQDEVLDFLK